jgi:hypothetical protein
MDLVWRNSRPGSMSLKSKGFKKWVRCKKVGIIPVSALDGKDVLEQGSGCYRWDMERRARTYEGEAHQYEEKGDSVRRFSHRGELSQTLQTRRISTPLKLVCPRSSYI